MARPGTWPKGTSGNPGGLPKGLAEVVALARAETPACIAALCRIRDDHNSPPAAVVAASTALLDRAWGRPTTVLAGDEDRGPVHISFEWAAATPPVVAVTTAVATAVVIDDDDAHSDTEQYVVEWQTPC